MALNQSTESQTTDTALPVLIWTSGLDQKYDFFNQGWLDFTGSQLSQNINEAWLEFIHPDDLSSFRDTYQNAYVTENPFQFEFRLKRHDGRYRWILCNAIPRPNLAGEFSGYIATNIEVPDQREEEPEQTTIKEHFELVLNYITEGIWDWIDVDNDEQWWSPHFYELIGYQDQEIEPGFETFKRLLYPADAQRTLQALNAAIDNDTPFDIEFRLRVKGGEYHWFRGYAKVQRNSHGHAVRMTGSISDIHQRILAEKELKESRKQADQAIKLKNAFLSMMSHEIRTPPLRF